MVLIGGRPVLYVERGGHTLLTFTHAISHGPRGYRELATPRDCSTTR